MSNKPHPQGALPSPPLSCWCSVGSLSLQAEGTGAENTVGRPGTELSSGETPAEPSQVLNWSWHQQTGSPGRTEPLRHEATVGWSRGSALLLPSRDRPCVSASVQGQAGHPRSPVYPHSGAPQPTPHTGLIHVPKPTLLCCPGELPTGMLCAMVSTSTAFFSWGHRASGHVENGFCLRSVSHTGRQ